MSLHDRIAMKAILDGESAQLYRVAAQRHANGGWFFLIIAGVVWYLTSWYWSLIPFAFVVSKTLQSISSTMVADRLDKYESKER